MKKMLQAVCLVRNSAILPLRQIRTMWLPSSLGMKLGCRSIRLPLNAFFGEEQAREMGKVRDSYICFDHRVGVHTCFMKSYME